MVDYSPVLRAQMFSTFIWSTQSAQMHNKEFKLRPLECHPQSGLSSGPNPWKSMQSYSSFTAINLFQPDTFLSWLQ